MRFVALIALAFTTSAHAVGLADGVKIGEVTPESAVLWARLTAETEANHRVDKWDADQPHWTVPGADGSLHFEYWPKNDPKDVGQTAIHTVTADDDYCHQVKIEGLRPATEYRYICYAKGADGSRASIQESFTTAPASDAAAPIRFTVSTCQDFPRRDDLKNGHKIYRSMAALKPDFFVQTGDTLYYDKPDPFAKDIATARYKWNRLYALPFLREFHSKTPSYWMHDDHDVLKDDCWPGQTYGDLTWEQGLKVWREQIPQSKKPYRQFRWGKHLEIWLPEGREFRSPNTMKDGPEKSIFGKEQWKWLESSMTDSDATFKLFVSATPVVGPDRKNKKDNHANAGFEHEGNRLRSFLKSIPGCFVINGDRHWQYHSIDPESGIQEFGCGPASNQHAGGWSQDNKRPEHQFLRVEGGFLSIEIEPDQATVIHHDVDGKPVNTTVIPAPAN